jgi:ABC-type uncharacterized transport system fused permease/ATPase subunit
VRHNAEAIALYDGARVEANQLRKRLTSVIGNFKLLIPWQRHLTFFTAAYDNAAGLVLCFPGCQCSDEALIEGSGSKNNMLEALPHCRTILLEPSTAQHMRGIES